ncbi:MULTISPECIES: P-loop NTPase fold protein [unclassified Flavobacterium]|uniref:P-loop NTPase fold protein n=1 Tax=unclassified Flavobacterium TaxID=196869 RepID=UPI003F8EB661
MEVADKIIKIETTEILNNFKQHLEFDGNKRILFSGPFGTGKSTFLKEFSEKENEYFFYLKIFPVNYSVSANEDVFELIKFDLLLQLMGNFQDDIELEKEDFTLLLKSQIFIMERMKFMPLLYAILGFSEKIGTPIVKFIEALEKTVGDFKAFNDEIKIDEENDITAFLESIQNTKGSSHEMDAVSELIFDLIGRIKTKYPKKESVLIIDDLDRLDPEHIFRLFNIFSAHYDEINDKNKFGFDKVIFVCDIENIRKIFHHKYGADVDFSGYIDKFYSIKPFDFDNRKYIQEKVSAFMKAIIFDDKIKHLYVNNKLFHKTAIALIISLIEIKKLNLRVLLNINTVKVFEKIFKNYPSGDSIVTYQTPIIVLFHLLKNFYGSFEILQIRLNHLYTSLNKETLTSDSTYSNYSGYLDCTKGIISYCLPFILENEGREAKPNEIKTSFVIKYDCTIHYNEDYSEYNFKKFDSATKGNDATSEEVELNPFEILLDTFRICQKRSLLK